MNNYKDVKKTRTITYLILIGKTGNALNLATEGRSARHRLKLFLLEVLQRGLLPGLATKFNVWSEVGIYYTKNLQGENKKKEFLTLYYKNFCLNNFVIQAIETVIKKRLLIS